MQNNNNFMHFLDKNAKFMYKKWLEQYYYEQFFNIKSLNNISMNNFLIKICL